jgi:predicted enzyme related to lactoylglutathione lyase
MLAVRMNAIWYPIRDWEAAKRFYGETLGLKQTQVSDEQGWAAYAVAGGPPFFLVRKPERAGVPGGAVITFEVDDLAATREQLLRADVRIDGATQEGTVFRVITAYDPDGNMVEISQAVGQGS